MENRENVREKIQRRREYHSNSNGKLIFGILLILAGITFIAKNLNLIPDSLEYIIFSWQSILIIIGLLKISFDKNKTSGLIIFLIGAFFMVPKIFEISYNFSKIFWPIILLVIGTVLIFSNKKMSNFKKKRSYVDSQFDVVNIFSGGEKIIESQDFSGANITSIFGGSEIDARTAKISGDSAEINVLTIFGGTEIHIPQDWEVKLETFSIFGAFSDERRHLTQNENKKLLIVKGFVIFGGGEINN